MYCPWRTATREISPLIFVSASSLSVSVEIGPWDTGGDNEPSASISFPVPHSDVHVIDEAPDIDARLGWEWKPSNIKWLDPGVSSQVTDFPHGMKLTDKTKIYALHRVKGCPSQFPFFSKRTAYLVDLTEMSDLDPEMTVDDTLPRSGARNAPDAHIPGSFFGLTDDIKVACRRAAPFCAGVSACEALDSAFLAEERPLRARLYFIGTLIYYSVATTPWTTAMFPDYLPEHQNPAGDLDPRRRESKYGASDCCAFSKPFRATTTIVRSVKAGSIVSELEVIERNLQHYPNLQRFKSCLGDNSQITETMPGASALRARSWQLRRQLNRGNSNKLTKYVRARENSHFGIGWTHLLRAESNPGAFGGGIAATSEAGSSRELLGSVEPQIQASVQKDASPIWDTLMEWLEDRGRVRGLGVRLRHVHPGVQPRAGVEEGVARCRKEVVDGVQKWRETSASVNEVKRGCWRLEAHWRHSEEEGARSTMRPLGTCPALAARMVVRWTQTDDVRAGLRPYHTGWMEDWVQLNRSS
ncbi:hypothetical protein DFH09DRAFT_1085201 [Mycena vulgaris]|nr:hypothetical protein DFH09DRAFT_1085201 [Mycena vulgaris]